MTVTDAELTQSIVCSGRYKAYMYSGVEGLLRSGRDQNYSTGASVSAQSDARLPLSSPQGTPHCSSGSHIQVIIYAVTLRQRLLVIPSYLLQPITITSLDYLLKCCNVFTTATYLATLSRVLQIISFTLGTSSSRIPCNPTENEDSRVLLSYLSTCV